MEPRDAWPGCSDGQVRACDPARGGGTAADVGSQGRWAWPQTARRTGDRAVNVRPAGCRVNRRSPYRSSAYAQVWVAMVLLEFEARDGPQRPVADAGCATQR